MSNYLFGTDSTRLNMFNKTRHMALDAGLIHSKRKTFIDGISNRNSIESGTVNAHSRDHTAFTNRVDGPMKNCRGSPLNLHSDSGPPLHFATGGFATDGINADIGTNS